MNLALERRVSLLSTDELYTAVGRFVGLGRFEDPEFRDRLRLAAESAGRTPILVLDGLVGVIKGLLTTCSFVAALLVVSPVITAAVVLAAGPTLLGEVSLVRRRAAMLWELGPTERLEMAYSTLLAGVDAAKEVRLFGLADFLRFRLLAQRRIANAARWRLERRELTLMMLFSLVSAVVAGAALVWAVLAAQRGQLSVGSVSMTLASVAALQGAMAGVVSQIGNTHEGLLMFDHYRAVVDAEPDLPRAVGTRPVPALRQGIELRDVWFRYADDQPWVLCGVNLTYPHGRSLALVGLERRRGESTIVKLLCRFYDPCRGAILWDGADIRPSFSARRPARPHRRGVPGLHAVRPQRRPEHQIMGDVSSMDDPRARVVAAARRAGGAPDDGPRRCLAATTRCCRACSSTRADRRESPEDRRAPISGGQWQRLALARAFLRDRRDLMILDEPSSGLDDAGRARGARTACTAIARARRVC